MLESKSYALLGARVFDGDNFSNDKTIIIKNGVISEVLNGNNNEPNMEVINLDGLTLRAGFIDLQSNGCCGVLFNDDISEHTLEIMHKTNLRYGCTSFLPTLITTSDDNIKKAVDIVKEAHAKNPNNILGIHIEGPYISKIKKGAHNPIYIKPIDDHMVDFLCEAVKHVPIKITMAPEENDVNLIRKLVMAGVIMSVGHSNAKYEEAKEGIRNGISFATHLFNAMSALEGRNPGVVGAVLNSDSVYAGIIVDGHHVDYRTIELVKKVKQEKLFIVTDAVTPMGTDMESFYLADQKVYVKDGACINESGALAGANIDMMSSIKNAVDLVGISTKEALKMASLYPARAIGCDLRLGKISKGFVANLVAYDSNYKVACTIDNGRIIKF